MTISSGRFFNQKRRWWTSCQWNWGRSFSLLRLWPPSSLIPLKQNAKFIPLLLDVNLHFLISHNNWPRDEAPMGEHDCNVDDSDGNATKKRFKKKKNEKILLVCRVRNRIHTCKCQWRGWGQRSLRLQTSKCNTWQWKWLRWGNWESRIWNNTIPFGMLVG